MILLLFLYINVDIYICNLPSTKLGTPMTGVPTGVYQSMVRHDEVNIWKIGQLTDEATAKLQYFIYFL